MCLICVEYSKLRMTRDELKRALPEMVMFAKSEEERAHFKKLQTLESENSEEALQLFAEQSALHDPKAYVKKTY